MKDIPLQNKNNKNTLLFHPFIAEECKALMIKKLQTRWVGQGPSVDKFESLVSKRFEDNLPCVSTNSGTAALHIIYELENITLKDEIIAPLFTCTATNIPFLYRGANLILIDVNKSDLNMSIESIERAITEKTKLIVVVHYGGKILDLEKLSKIEKKYKIPIVQDAAHSFGTTFKGKPISSFTKYTMYSFQAIKTLTTGDGGMVVINSLNKKNNTFLSEKAKRIRWFGIDRKKKQNSTWSNNITEVGFKYQMNDIAATIGIGNLKYVKKLLKHRRKLLEIYNSIDSIEGLQNISGYKKSRSSEHGAWLPTILSDNRYEVQKKLLKHGIETNQVHYRNDRYDIIRNNMIKNFSFPNMDFFEDKYFVLPCHHLVSEKNAERIVNLLKAG